MKTLSRCKLALPFDESSSRKGVAERDLLLRRESFCACSHGYKRICAGGAAEVRAFVAKWRLSVERMLRVHVVVAKSPHQGAWWHLQDCGEGGRSRCHWQT